MRKIVIKRVVTKETTFKLPRVLGLGEEADRNSLDLCDLLDSDCTNVKCSECLFLESNLGIFRDFINEED